MVQFQNSFVFCSFSVCWEKLSVAIVWKKWYFAPSSSFLLLTFDKGMCHSSIIILSISFTAFTLLTQESVGSKYCCKFGLCPRLLLPSPDLSPPFYGPLITFVPNETSVFPRPSAEAECTFHCRPITVALSHWGGSAYIPCAYKVHYFSGNIVEQRGYELCKMKTAFQVLGEFCRRFKRPQRASSRLTGSRSAAARSV